MDWQIAESGSLIFTMGAEERADFDWDNVRTITDLVAETELSANGELYPVSPEDIGALTDGCILTDEAFIGDAGEHMPIGRMWWDRDYAVTSLVEQLRNTGVCIIPAAPGATFTVICACAANSDQIVAYTVHNVDDPTDTDALANACHLQRKAEWGPDGDSFNAYDYVPGVRVLAVLPGAHTPVWQSEVV